MGEKPPEKDLSGGYGGDIRFTLHSVALPLVHLLVLMALTGLFARWVREKGEALAKLPSGLPSTLSLPLSTLRVTPPTPHLPAKGTFVYLSILKMTVGGKFDMVSSDLDLLGGWASCHIWAPDSSSPLKVAWKWD